MMLIDWNRFVLLLLPIRLRVGTVFGFIRACLAPLAKLHDDLREFSDGPNGVKYKLAHTCQVWSIQAVINDRFDPVERRIYIIDTDDYDAIFLQPDDDQLPVYLDTDAYSDLLLHPDSSYSASGFDFVIVLPYAFAESDLYQLKALVNYYKLAGVRYDIVVIETL